MATFQELKVLMGDSDLQDKVEVSMIMGVQAILDGTPTTADYKYAAHVFSNTIREGKKALASVLAQNSTLSVAAIQGATDAGIEAQVASVIPALSASFNAV